MIRKRWAVATLAVAIAFVLGGGATLVLAGGTAITAQANSLAVIKTVAVEFVQTTSGSYVDAPGLARNATSTGTSNLFVARLEAVPDCGGGPSTFCDVRIAVKDNANSIVDFMNPDADTFASIGEQDHPMGIERSIAGLAPATYTFQVQFRAAGDPGLILLTDIHFTLERYT